MDEGQKLAFWIDCVKEAVAIAATGIPPGEDKIINIAEKIYDKGMEKAKI